MNYQYHLSLWLQCILQCRHDDIFLHSGDITIACINYNFDPKYFGPAQFMGVCQSKHLDVPTSLFALGFALDAQWLVAGYCQTI